MIQSALRLTDVKLQNILTGVITGVRYGYRNIIRSYLLHILRKSGVAQTIAKGIPGLDTLFVEPAVTYINTFRILFVVQIAVLVSKGIRAGIILVAVCPGVRQLAAGVNLACQNIRQGIAALHTTLTVE